MSNSFLVTGAGGQLGREFTRMLTLSGADVTALSSSELDITNSDAVRNAVEKFKPAYIINCAAYTAVDMAEDEPERCNAVNALAPQVIAGVSAEHNILLIHFSTDYVFSGEPDEEDVKTKGYPVTYPASPLGVYGRSKWEGEQAVRHSGCRHIIIRVSWLCGYFGKNFVKTMLRLAKDKDSLRVVSDQIGSPSFTAQVVSQTRALIEADANGTFHVASDGLLSWFELASESIRLAGIPCEVIPIRTHEYPTKATRPAFSKLDCSATSKITTISMGDWTSHLKQLIDELSDEYS